MQPGGAPHKLKIVFFGTSEFAVPILEKLAQSPYRPVLVVTNPDAPVGRSGKLTPPPVKVASDRLGLPAIQPENLEMLKSEIREADLFVVAAYGKILPPDLLAVPKRGSLNVHPSLLPRWRGASPIQHAILAGDAETGVAVILMDEKVDHGPILKNSKIKIQNAKVTTPELTERLAEMGAELLGETIPAWLAGKITPQPQDELKATYTRKLGKEDGRVDWSKSAEEIERMVRAFLPWPGAYTFWQRHGNQLRLVVEEAAGREQALERRDAPGTVLAPDEGLAVQTGGGVLVLKRVKQEGQRSVGAEEFRRGHPAIIGAVLN